MSNKQRMILVLTAVMILSVAVGAFAATELDFNGYCKKSFLSSKYIEKTSSESWSLFHVDMEIISVDNYAYARPETSAGKTCGTRFQVVVGGNGTSFLPNDRGATTNEVHVKLYTKSYVEDGTASSSSIHLVGTMNGTK